MIGKSISNADEVTESDIPAPQRGKRPRSRGAGFALFIAAIALFFTVVGIAAGYKHWQRMHDRAKDNARRIDVMETALAAKMDSRDLAALMTMPVTDTTAVSAKVNQLLAQLPLNTEISKANTESSMRNLSVTALAGGKATTSVDRASNPDNVLVENSSFWSTCKQSALALLRRFVAVRKIEPSTAAMLQIEEQEALHSLIQLRLESLRLMALQGDQQAYQQQVTLLRSTLDESSSYSSKQLAMWREALDELASVDLQPKHHDISEGLRQLRQSQRENLVGIEQ